MPEKRLQKTRDAYRVENIVVAHVDTREEAIGKVREENIRRRQRGAPAFDAILFADVAGVHHISVRTGLDIQAR